MDLQFSYGSLERLDKAGLHLLGFLIYDCWCKNSRFFCFYVYNLPVLTHLLQDRGSCLKFSVHSLKLW